MPDQSKSHITLILDRSGSMSSVATDVVGAVNRFIDEQRAVPGACSFTLVQFDDQDPYETVYDGPLSSARHLSDETYRPRGNTPLLDAIGKGIVDLGAKLSAMPEGDRPGKVIFVVQTDGMENASKEWTDRGRLADIIKTQTEKYRWQFVFLGANQDAILTGKGLNVAAASSLSYANTSKGVQNAMRASSANISSFRADPNAHQLCAYSAKQREEAMQV